MRHGRTTAYENFPPLKGTTGDLAELSGYATLTRPTAEC